MAARKGQAGGQLQFAFEGSPAERAETEVRKVTAKRAKKTKVKKAAGKDAKAKKAAPKKPAVKSAFAKSVKRKSAAKKRSAGPKKAASSRRRKRQAAATAESMADKQRAISISEFFAKNRHLLGFDNPRKALLTAVKEAVDNSLDACEEAQILPDLVIDIRQLSDRKFVLKVRDNGPGILKEQVPNIFARLLYGSKFHSLKMSRGQQGIGISAAGMYGLLTTGEPVQIISRTSPKKNAHHYHVQIDTSKNRPQVVLDEKCEFELATGTSVTITLEGKYLRGRRSVDEYVSQTAMANPHATIVYNAPDGQSFEYCRKSEELPFVPREIKPHPYGVELGLLYKMARDSGAKQLTSFLQNEFSRVSLRVANQICDRAGLRRTLRPSRMTLKQAELLHQAINETKIMAPSTDCIGPIGPEELEAGLKRVVDADFYCSCSRSPAVYRGNPFLVEAALAYGIKGGDNGDPNKEPLMRLSRIANRVPLLYQQSACAIYRSVMDVNWRNYALSQSRGALPTGPVMLMVHFASVWVPFTSESKEAIAHYPEIIKEIQLAVQDCGRKLGMYLRKRKRIQQEMAKRNYIETYLPYIGQALQEILSLKTEQVDAVVGKLKTVLEKSRKF